MGVTKLCRWLILVMFAMPTLVLAENSSSEPTTGMEFVFVKGGCYAMGDSAGDGDPNERPVHEVCISDSDYP